MCRAFRTTSSAVLCDRAPRQPNQVRLRPPPAWWGPEDRKSVRRAVRGHADAADFQCAGNRQNAKILEGVDVAAALGAWEPSVAARAAALWESEVRGPAGRDAVVVSLYHRVAADSLAYRKCLPGPGFYAAARAAFEALYPGRRVAYVASSYQFKGAAAVADVLGADVVAIDDASPEVVMAALSKADARRRRSSPRRARRAACAQAATFSWGTFSFWTAYLTGGPVFYDAGLRDASWLAATGCDALVRTRKEDNVSAFADEHLPAAWRPLAYG